MMLKERLRDCPDCGAAGSVHHDRCDNCDVRITAEEPILHPSIPLRFADVVAELQGIAAMAEGEVVIEGLQLAMACRRAESLLRILRAQFLQDVAWAGDPLP
jgi:hypothetical protein